MQKILVALLVAPLLSACATGYHAISTPVLGFTGGYWDQKGPGELYKIGFAGNGFSERDQVASYLLKHASEVTRSQGKPYFILYRSLPAAIADKRSSDKQVSTLGGKPTDYVYILPVATQEQSAIAAE